MKNIEIVIGSQYGDEGKGGFTSFISHKTNSDITVRFNSGSQAGHTVIYNNIKHVSSSFSATVLQNKITYWSEYFVINPTAFIAELNVLKSKGITNPNVISSDLVYLTTPYDISLNHIKEFMRGDLKHGSVGHGFFETLKREEIFNNKFNVSISMNTNKLFEKLTEIYNQYAQIIKEYDYESIAHLIPTTRDISRYIQDVIDMSKLITLDVNYEQLNRHNSIVFEGAQGLFLDKNNIDEFPHLTYSNTGSVNAKRIIEQLDNVKQINRFYITRPYTTKHGAGRLNGEVKNMPFNIVDETNQFNCHQDNLRFAPIDNDKMIRFIANDMNKLTTNTNNLCISCLDQTTNYMHTTAGVLNLSEYIKSQDIFDNVYGSNNFKWNVEY